MVKRGNKLANFLTSFLGHIIPLMVKVNLDCRRRAKNKNRGAPTLEQRQGAAQHQLGPAEQGVGAIVEGVGAVAKPGSRQ